MDFKRNGSISPKMHGSLFHTNGGELQSWQVIENLEEHPTREKQCLEALQQHLSTTVRSLEARAKEVKKIVEGMIALAVKEKDNYEVVKVTAKVARKDANGKRVKEVVDGKKVTVYDEVEKEIKKDMPSRLHARRQMLKTLYTVTDVPTEAAGKKRNTKKVDLPAKLFDEIAPKYENRNGGYTRIIKIGQRKGDGAMAVLLELV